MQAHGSDESPRQEFQERYDTIYHLLQQDGLQLYKPQIVHETDGYTITRYFRCYIRQAGQLVTNYQIPIIDEDIQVRQEDASIIYATLYCR